MLVLLTVSLGACSAPGIDAEEIRTHFTELDGFAAQIEILSDLGETTLAYTLDYAYHKESADTFAITAPEALAGISGTVAGNDRATLTLQYDDMVLDDAMPYRPGLTPADSMFCLLADLRQDSPAQQWSETVDGQKLIVLRYESEDDVGAVARQVWLTADDYRPVCAELYADGKRVLYLQITSYQQI